jgi:hypothetical protein
VSDSLFIQNKIISVIKTCPASGMSVTGCESAESYERSAISVVIVAARNNIPHGMHTSPFLRLVAEWFK